MKSSDKPTVFVHARPWQPSMNSGALAGIGQVGHSIWPKTLTHAVIFLPVFLIAVPLFASAGFSRSAPDPSSHMILGKCFTSSRRPSDPKAEYTTMCFRAEGQSIIMFMDPVALDGFDNGFEYTVKGNALHIKASDFLSQHCRLDLERLKNSFVLSGCRFAGRWVEALDPFVHKQK